MAPPEPDPVLRERGDIQGNMHRGLHVSLMVLACLPACLAACVVAGAVELDPGGFTVDFRGVGETAVEGEELLHNGNMEAVNEAGLPAEWEVDAYVWLPTPDPEAQARMFRRLRPMMQWGSTQERPHGGQRALTLTIPRSAYQDADPPGHEFCAFFHQQTVLEPLERDTTYVLSWSHRGWSAADVPNSRPYARVTFYDSAEPGAGAQTRVYAQRIFASTDRWQYGELAFSAPRTTRRLDVRLALTGCGEVSFDDVSLRRGKAQEPGPSVRLMPGHFLDNLYCLSSGDAGVMNFGFRNETGGPIEQPHLLLQLPAGVEIIGLPGSVPILERQPVQDGTRYRLDVTALKGRMRDGTFGYPYNMWEGLAVVLRTALPASAQALRARYWLEDGQYRTESLDFDLRIVPPLPAVTGPARFRSGTHLFLLHAIEAPEAVAALARLYRQVGLNCVHVPASALGAELGRLGIERYTQPLANGYTMGDRRPGAKPEDAVFRLADGTPVWEAICPVEVYTRGPYFRAAIEEGILRRILVTERSAEQIMCNWEPYMYNGRGCFCDRCREEFRAFSGLGDEEIARVWPGLVVREHPDLWARFRSWQHGRLMVTLEESVQALGAEAGLESHFIPEISIRLVTSAWQSHPDNREYAAVDYLGRLPVLNAWGPYNWYVFGRGPYDYVRGLHLSCHVTASEVLDFVAEQVAPAAPPRMIAFPYGTYEGATEPEALGFEMLTYFVEGYHGAFAYLFPGGYDARYWRALAEANRLMAQCEQYIAGATPVRRHEITPESPLPAPDPRFLHNCRAVENTERWADLPLLLSWEYEHGDTRLVAVGNFWERGECFFRLKLEGLRADRQYLLHEPAHRRVYAGDDGDTALSAEDLSRGVLLHAGAMRYAFFVLEPYRDGTDYGERVLPAEMAAALAERLPALERARDDSR